MFRVEVWLTTTLISIGIIGGLIFNWPRPADSALDVSRDSVVEQPVEGQTLPAPDVDRLDQFEDLVAADPAEENTQSIEHSRQGDEFLEVGNYVGAHREYIKAIHQNDQSESSLLLVKLGLSSEQAGYLDQADKYYRQAIRHSQRRPNDRLLALAGLSRIWQARGQVDESLELLSELFLRYDSDENVPHEIRLQVAFELGNVAENLFLAARSQAETTSNDSDSQPVVEPISSTRFYRCPLDIEGIIEVMETQPNTVRASSGDLTEGLIEILQRPTEDVHLIAIDSRTEMVPVTSLLHVLGEKAELDFQLSVKARATLSGRSTRLAVSGLSLAIVLDNLLAPLDLFWVQEDTRIRVRHLGEAADQVASYRFEQAERMLRHIELSFPRDQRRTAMLLHRANLNLITGRHETAETLYAELVKLDPNGELSAKLSLNMALLDLARDRKNSAVKRLFHAIDQSLDYRLQATGYDLIGRVELANGNAEQAIYATSRGLSLVIDPVLKESFVMTMAKAYLLESDPLSANKVLFDHAVAILNDTQKRMASMLAAYSRFLGQTQALGMRNEGERLIIALAAVQSLDLDDFIDQLLVGRAYYEVGLTNRSSELMQRAMKNATGENWRRRIAYELGIQYFRSGDAETARDVFAELAADLNDIAGVESQIKLAEIVLEQRDSQRCLDLCEQLWGRSLNDENKARTLNMMGHAYRQMKRPHAAAVCFSGMVPSADNGSGGNEKTTSVKGSR